MIKAMNVCMKPYSEAEVMDFISKFGPDREALKGEMNYWFARILCERFDGLLEYRPVTGAFCVLIGNDFYDASGKIDRKGIASNDMYNWDSYKIFEPLESARIIRDAILKIPAELVTDAE